jgi:ADP-ribose pyrophosphatase
MAGGGRRVEYAAAGGAIETIAEDMKLTSTKEVYRCKLFWITEDEAEEKDFKIKRSVVRHHGSAVMMAIDQNKRVLLVRQYRLPAGKMLWELPAGKVDEGEKVLQTAKRELIEETGYRAKTWKKLVSYYPSPGYVAEKMTIFVAKDLTEGEAQPMDDERIEKRWFTRKEIDKFIRAGKIDDGKTLVGYLLWSYMK